MTKRFLLAAAVLAATLTGAAAQQYSRQQQEAACSDDAFRLCNDAVPDEARVTACMIQKRASLTQRCRLVFDASMPPAEKRRR